jgi:SAM-dependent methyltransferase
MNTPRGSGSAGSAGLRAEFDAVAEEYDEQHGRNIAVTGEKPEYFAEYKIASLARLVRDGAQVASSVLDFGSGIGNSIPFFRSYFPRIRLCCADVSERCIELSKRRFPGMESYIQVGASIPLPSESQDIVFSACVFHHIPHEDHVYWLGELRRVTRPGGLLALYEHNPWNPLTVHAVNTCPFDANAKLISSRAMRRRVLASGWADPQVAYEVFFPSVLRALRPLESSLWWLSLGAQYRTTARRPA